VDTENNSTLLKVVQTKQNERILKRLLRC